MADFVIVKLLRCLIVDQANPKKKCQLANEISYIGNTRKQF